jgi:1,2-diacylglycerol 3-alpha-glucosyltransferase
MGMPKTPDDPVMVTVGRVAKEKGMDMIIRAMPAILKVLPRAKYVSVGDGPYMSELKILAQSLGVTGSVVFAGARPWTQIGKYYQACDVFVSASTSETQGIVYIEAMAAQVPLIVRRDKSVEEILLDGETGLFFDTAEELAGHAVSLLSDPRRRKHLSDTAYAHIQPLSADIFAERMEAMYRRLIDENPKRKPWIKLTLPIKRK